MCVRERLYAALMAGCCVALVLGTRMQAQTDDKAHELLSLTNQDRADHGLQPLKWDPALATAAQAHTGRMAVEKSLSHQYAGEPDPSARAAKAGAHFQAIAENTAMGPNAESIEKEWMNSTPHRTNILDPQMNAIGIGLVEKGGYLYATEDFANAAESLGLQQVEDKVSALLHDQSVDTSGPRQEAEKACERGSGLPTGSAARSVVRFQTSDLTQLPPEITQQIKSGNFTKVAVGACSPASQGNFTAYRVAVLLY